MKELIAVVRMNMMNKTKRALADAGLGSITARDALGRGKGIVDLQLLQGADLSLDLADGVGVVLRGRHLQQVRGIAQAVGKLLQAEHHGFQGGTLPPQGLRPLRVGPDLGILEFAQDLGQAFLFLRVVKGTPSALRRAAGGRPVVG